jgi:hypothetical protein
LIKNTNCNNNEKLNEKLCGDCMYGGRFLKTQIHEKESKLFCPKKCKRVHENNTYVKW